MDTEERLEEAERELAAAERRNHWLLVALATAVVVTAGMGLALFCTWTRATAAADAPRAMAIPTAIPANKFLLQDENGKVSAILTVERYGPASGMADEEEELSLRLAVFKGEPWNRSPYRVSLTDFILFCRY